MSKLDRLQRLDLLGVSVPPVSKVTQAGIALDGDEAPWGWSEAEQSAMTDTWRQTAWHRRPASERALRQLVGEAMELDAEWVALGPGHHALIADVLKAWGIPGTVLYPTPTDPLYGLVAHSLGLSAVGVMSEADFSLDPAQVILSCAHQEARVLILGNPNNPTGHGTPPADALQIVDACEALVIVDETHLLDSRFSVAHAVSRYDNLVVVKNASPGFPMAALPLAWAIAHPRVIAEIAKVQIPNTVSESALLAARHLFQLRHQGEAAAAAIASERTRLCEALTRVRGVVTWPSVAPFILIGTTWPAEELAAKLFTLGITVQAFSRSPLMNCIRVTIGQAPDNDALLTALQQLFGAVMPDDPGDI